MKKPDYAYEDFLLKGIIHFPKTETKIYDDGKEVTKFSMSLCLDKKSMEILKAKVKKIRSHSEYSSFKTPIADFRKEEEQYVELQKVLPKEYEWRIKVSAALARIDKVQIKMKDADLSELKNGDYAVVGGTLSITTEYKRVICYLKTVGVLTQKKFALTDGIPKDTSKFDKEYATLMEGNDDAPVDEFENQLDEADVPM